MKERLKEYGDGALFDIFEIAIKLRLANLQNTVLEILEELEYDMGRIYSDYRIIS